METFNWPVQTKPTGTINFRTKAIAFNDGYEQRSGDGINQKHESWAITVDNEPAVTSAVSAFLDRHGGYKKFLWTPPYGAQGYYVARAYQKVPHLDNQVIITATFEQTF